MALSSIWWLMAGIAVIAELLTGTLYLLMVAIGLAAAAIAAHLGAGETLQVVVAAAVSGATVLACYLRQKRLGALHNTQGDRSIHLDIAAPWPGMLIKTRKSTAIAHQLCGAASKTIAFTHPGHCGAAPGHAWFNRATGPY